MSRNDLPPIDIMKPHVILYGLDADGRTRAGLFGPLEAELAKAAAASMKFNFAAAATPELIDIAVHLKQGTIYRRGPSFLPVVKRQLYERLVSVVGRDITAFQPRESRKVITHGPPRTPPRELASDQVAPSKLPAKPHLPTDWAEIREGDLVIAQANPTDGWWEAIVVATNYDELLIKWRDFPKFRQLKRKRYSVALLHPKK